tara:strand:+ start:892 stop:1101 length:210 start_codon:yes stop_codon:yes gene_type:complete
MNGYNGWSNKETWLVNLWYNPETKSDIDYIEETLESDLIDKLGDASNIYMDFINFNLIDWDELRNNQDE